MRTINWQSILLWTIWHIEVVKTPSLVFLNLLWKCNKVCCLQMWGCLRQRARSGVFGVLWSFSSELESKVLIIPRSHSSLSLSLSTTGSFRCFVSDSCGGSDPHWNNPFFRSVNFGVWVCGSREERLGVVAAMSLKLVMVSIYYKSQKIRCHTTLEARQGLLCRTIRHENTTAMIHFMLRTV